MANRVALPVLGNTLAPFSSSVQLAQGNISETWHVGTEQIDKGMDTSTAQRAAFPAALSYVYIKYTKATTPNHYAVMKVYLSINAAAVDALTG